MVFINEIRIKWDCCFFYSSSFLFAKFDMFDRFIYMQLWYIWLRQYHAYIVLSICAARTRAILQPDYTAYFLYNQIHRINALVSLFSICWFFFFFFWKKKKHFMCAFFLSHLVSYDTDTSLMMCAHWCSHVLMMIFFLLMWGHRVKTCWSYAINLVSWPLYESYWKNFENHINLKINAICILSNIKAY